MTTDLIVAADAALEGVSPGPWQLKQAYGFVVDRDGEGVMDTRSTTSNDARFIAWCREGVPALRDALARLETWDGLMELMDRRWPEDIFPTGPDRGDRDAGPRILSLARRLGAAEAERDQLRAEVKRLTELVDRLGWCDPGGMPIKQCGRSVCDCGHRLDGPGDRQEG